MIRRLSAGRTGLGLAAGAAALSLLAFAGLRRGDALSPDRDRVFASARSITCLLALPNGEVWAGTTGGIRLREADGQWRRFDRGSGLPAHEVRDLRPLPGGGVEAIFPTATVAWKNGRWRTTATHDAVLPKSPGTTCRSVRWRGGSCAGTVEGLRWEADAKMRTVPPPSDSRGSHVSALLAEPGGGLLVAMYGDDRLWRFDGTAWNAEHGDVPPGAREVTALAEGGGSLWVGTRHDGLWERREGTWSQVSEEDEPFAHDVQALAAFDGALYVSDLENGMSVRTPDGWSRVDPDALSSGAPRGMVVFRGRLYVRNADGQIDRFDGKTWSRDVFSRDLPRRECSAMATDGRRLYVAQWGGWSEWDGTAWTHRLRIPALQGRPLTVLFPDTTEGGAGTLWVGVQGRGLAEINAATGEFRGFRDERNGLPDDWVTAIARAGKMLFAGTFAGGLARKADGKESWKPVKDLASATITALAPDGAGGLYVATRSGAWRLNAGGALERLAERHPILDPETQALLPTSGGVWVGTRTGLYFLAG
jgi:ligand-binding sensor domain-containing protein